jgi:hypothetical protein
MLLSLAVWYLFSGVAASYKTFLSSVQDEINHISREGAHRMLPMDL